MKDFLKYMFATVAGIIVFGIFITFFVLMSVFSSLMSQPQEVSLSKGSLMTLNIDGMMKDKATEDMPDLSFLPMRNNTHTHALNEVLAAIKKAADNEDVAGIYLNTSSPAAGYAELDEVREALKAFKEKGKFIIAYADIYSQQAYFLASVADRIFLNPQGAIDWRGLSAQPMFYKEMLEKVGMQMQIFRVGRYKSAVEPYIAMQMSPENREQMQKMLDDIWGKVHTDVAVARGLTPERMNALADSGIVFREAEAAVKAHMADSLVFEKDMKTYLKGYMGLSKDDKLNLVSYKKMLKAGKKSPKKKNSGTVAVYYAEGEITATAGNGLSNDLIAGDQMVKDLEKLRKNEDIKAVVLRVNSPGGSAFASEQIFQAVKALKAEKPVIVSMGQYAASGGYYISCIADSIVAQPKTITRSIEIISMYPSVEKLREKIGLGIDVVKTNKFANTGSMMQTLNSEEKAMIQATIERGYDTFLSRCAEGRHKDKQAIAAVAEGRVWSGKAAKELGLVDVLGGLNTAIELAVKKAGLTEGYKLTEYPEKASFLDSLMKRFVNEDALEEKMQKLGLGAEYKAVKTLTEVQSMQPIQARMPYVLEIK